MALTNSHFPRILLQQKVCSSMPSGVHTCPCSVARILFYATYFFYFPGKTEADSPAQSPSACALVPFISGHSQGLSPGMTEGFPAEELCC